jgi:hypothetical protein
MVNVVRIQGARGESRVRAYPILPWQIAVYHGETDVLPLHGEMGFLHYHGKIINLPW